MTWALMVSSALATAVGVAAVLWQLTGKDRFYILPFCCALGSSALVNLLVKEPAAEAVAAAGSTRAEVAPASPLWFLAFALLLPPVSEEVVKALPALLPRVRARATRSWLRTGLALGCGFGVGETGFVGWVIVRADGHGPDLAGWCGYAMERAGASLGHGVMTALVLWGFAGRRRLLGLLAAVALHTVLNLVAFLDQLVPLPPMVVGLSFQAGMALLLGAFVLLKQAESREETAAGPPEQPTEGQGGRAP
ncbi:hypothetical protein [Streptomyces sp. SID14515]|uniref:hypothetical protein n=1 Tax=Streptomyces sp. SID14515 TaxID=2706074 RepID=UPI0013C5E154|nr:hypothetical protein [Streptomyces sp. SID14515]NEB41870.1 hypothetical protein [Streptomyces sp. SID14515]